MEGGKNIDIIIHWAQSSRMQLALLQEVFQLLPCLQTAEGFWNSQTKYVIRSFLSRAALKLPKPTLVESQKMIFKIHFGNMQKVKCGFLHLPLQCWCHLFSQLPPLYITSGLCASLNIIVIYKLTFKNKNQQKAY